MFIITSKNFDKKFKKVTRKVQLQAKSRIIIFAEQPFDLRLNNHLLHGDKKLLRSININSDMRIIYEEVGSDIVRFLDIDIHSNLYK